MVDGHGRGGGQAAVKVASLDVVAVMVEGQEGQETGPSNAHCKNCSCAGFVTVSAAVTRFIVGVVVHTALRAGQVIFDVWKKEGQGV